MALSQSDKNEIQSLIKKEIKDFIGANTTKQFEDKVVDLVIKDLKRGKTEKEMKDLNAKVTSMKQKTNFDKVFDVYKQKLNETKEVISEVKNEEKKKEFLEY
jgi:light-regulated signal transduction histidine kinase (bacteriophytochrome)